MSPCRPRSAFPRAHAAVPQVGFVGLLCPDMVVDVVAIVAARHDRQRDPNFARVTRRCHAFRISRAALRRH